MYKERVLYGGSVEAEHERATMIQPRKRVASLTVLVVDDDLAIVEVVREIQEDEGYTVLTAPP